MTALVAREILEEQTNPSTLDFLAPLKKEVDWLCEHAEQLQQEDLLRALEIHPLAYSLSTKALTAFVEDDILSPQSIRVGIGIADYAGRIMLYAVFKVDPTLIPSRVFVGADDLGAFIESLEGAYRYWCATRGRDEAIEKLFQAVHVFDDEETVH